MSGRELLMATAFNVENLSAPTVAGKITFLRPEERELFLLGRIAVVAERRENDGSFVFFVSGRGRISGDWLSELRFVVLFDSRLEVHEVVRLRLTKSGVAARIVTTLLRRLNQCQLPGIVDNTHAVFMTNRAARVVKLS